MLTAYNSHIVVVSNVVTTAARLCHRDSKRRGVFYIVSKKRTPGIFSHNFTKTDRISTIFGTEDRHVIAYWLCVKSLILVKNDLRGCYSNCDVMAEQPVTSSCTFSSRILHRETAGIWVCMKEYVHKEPNNKLSYR